MPRTWNPGVTPWYPRDCMLRRWRLLIPAEILLPKEVHPLQNLDVTNKLISAGYVQTFGLFNKLARVSASLPYGFLNGTADFHGVDTSASRTGFYDGRIKFGINLLGSPLMTPKEFQKFQEHTVLGVSMVLSVPVGQYFPTKLVNLGSNRWGFKPEIGFSHGEGRLFLEMYTGVWIYTNNAQYYNGHSLDQKQPFYFPGACGLHI